MKRVRYDGPYDECDISVYGIRFKRWKKGSIKNVSDFQASILNKVKTFTVLEDDDKKISKKKYKKEDIEKVVSDIEVDKDEIKMEKEIDIFSMTKDELLDYTAINNIEADYSMTKKELRDLILKKIKKRQE